MINAKEFEREF
jgi:hypothetical protein